MFSVGDKIGNYTILKLLGEGGMGEVFLGEHRHIARKAAIKVIRQEGAAAFQQQLIERFFTEARAASLIQHPGIVEILDCDVVPNGPPFIVMEYLQGEGLESCLTRLPRLGGDHNAVALVLAQVADALAAAHEQGIVHRDLKPANIFLVHRTHDPNLPFRAKVLDFGIAKLAAASGGKSRLTQTGAILGTPVYMSPEQCRGAAAVDHRSDIYSLGCVAYEMFSGTPPFSYEANGALIIAHASEAPAPIAERVPSIPPALGLLVDRMLAKRPEDRPQSMNEVSTIARAAIQTSAPTGHTIVMAPAAAPTPPPAAFLGLGDGHTSQSTYALPPDPIVSPRPEREKETTFGQAAAAISTLPNRRPRKTSVVLGAILSVAGLSGVVAWYVSSRPAERPAVAAAVDPPAPVPVEEPVKEAVEQPVPDVKVVLTSVPEGAQVWIEGEERERGRTPVELSLKPVPGELKLRFEREGYLPTPLSVPSDQSGRYSAQLEKRVQKPKAVARPRRPVPSEPEPQGYEQLVE